MRLRNFGFVFALMTAMPGAAWAARDVMLVLDNSGSMRRNDPARLTVAAVQEFIQLQPFDTRVGIVRFTDVAELAAPLTPLTDEATPALIGSLAALDYRGQWTQTAGAVERALYELRLKGRPQAQRAIVLVTDGLIDTGNATRDGELKAWLQGPLAADAQRDGVRIFGVAFTERADYQLLQALAASTGAEYFRVLDAADLAAALQRIEAMLSTAAPAAPESFAPAAVEAEAAAPAPPPSVGAERPRSLAWLWLSAAAIAFALLALRLWRRRRTPAARPAAAAATGEPPGPQAVLVDLAYPTGPRRYPVAHRPVVIGRKAGSDPSQDYVVVPDKTVGRWHATIFRQGQSFTIRDENSMNGTFINNERIKGEHPLRHSDIVRVHGHTFEFLIPDLANSESTVMLPGR